MKTQNTFRFQTLLLSAAVIFGAVSPASAIISNGKAESVQDLYVDTTNEKLVPVKILADYRKSGKSGVLDLGTYTAEQISANQKAALEAANQRYDGWNVATADTRDFKLGCTSVIKKFDNGTLIMGRNMDLPSSFYPAYIFRTKGNGKDTYDTVNIGYTTPGPETFDQIAETGSMVEKFYNSIPFTVTDAMNSAGLVIEANMRNPSGAAASSGTNPGALRVSELNLARMIADHCADISQMLEYVKNLDVYTPHSKYTTWHICLAMMDKTGRYGVLEFVSNKVVWNEGRPGFACGQANFFWDQTAFKNSPEEIGLGRWNELMKRYDSLKAPYDVEEAMKYIWYSDFITKGTMSRSWKVDWRTEWVDSDPELIQHKFIDPVVEWQKKYSVKSVASEQADIQKFADEQKAKKILWTTDYVNSIEGSYVVYRCHDFYTRNFAQLPADVKKLTGMMEMSTISYIIDTSSYTYKLHLFETADVYTVSLTETKIQKPAKKQKKNSRIEEILSNL